MPSEKEIAEGRESVARSDALYIDRGALSADEVASSRFGGDRYSSETMLDKEARQQDDRERERVRMVQKSRVAQQLNAAPPQEGEEPLDDPREDAPEYRALTEDEDGSVACSKCDFSDGIKCSRWDFVWDSKHVCNDWTEGRTRLTRLDSSRRRKNPRGRNS